MKKKPPVLLIGNHLSASGFNPGVCESLAVRLSARGWHTLTTSDRPARLARLCDMLATVWELRHDYDVAHVDVYSGNAFFWAEAACRLVQAVGKPYVATLRGGNLARFARRWPRRVARLLGSATAVTTPSRFLYDCFRANCRDFQLIPNAVDVAAYHYRPRRHVSPRLVWVRAFHRIYQPELAVAMLAELVRQFPAAQLTMAGPDKGDGSLAQARRVAERCGVAQHVAFREAVPKRCLPELLDSADIFLNTSRVDNTPVSVLEAMAAGMCIVSTNAGGLPYLLRNEHDALLTGCEHPEEMAVAVRRVLTERGLAGQLSRNARRSVEPFDWPVVLPQWERLFLTIAEDNSA